MNIDDGAQSSSDSIPLISDSMKNGVSKILATPHIHLGTFDNDHLTIAKAFSALIDDLKAQQLNIFFAY